MSEQRQSIVIYNKEESSTRVNVDPATIDKGSVIAYWGEDNNLPAEIIKQGGLSGVFVGNMGILRKAHFGNGITLYRNIKNDTGKIHRQIEHLEFLPEELQSFWKKSKFDRYSLEKIYDLEMFNISFSEYILTKDFQKIHKVKRIPSAWCRFSLMNPKNRLVEYVYVKTNWDNDKIEKDTPKIPVIDFDFSAEEVKEYCKTKKIRKFIRPEFYPQVMEAYYPNPEYLATFKNGWLKHATSIPEIKNAIIKNELHIKYIIYISDQYFERYFTKEVWKNKKPEEKQILRDTLYKAIDNHLSGKKSAGKSLKSFKFINSQGQYEKGIEVEEIGTSKAKTEGNYLTDASAANQETSFAMGVDPSIIGAGIPGGKLGAGSGSDKREAYTILSSLMKTNRSTSIDAFYFIKDYNGWDVKLHADYSNTVLTTLDKNPTGSENKM